MKFGARAALQPEPGNLWVVDLAPGTESILQEVCDGLSQAQKQLPPKLFYDRRGAALFAAICGTQAYYPTRTENAILDRRAVEIAREIGPGLRHHRVRRRQDREGPAAAAEPAAQRCYAALDISRDQLVQASSPPGARLPVAGRHRRDRRLRLARSNRSSACPRARAGWCSSPAPRSVTSSQSKHKRSCGGLVRWWAGRAAC